MRVELTVDELTKIHKGKRVAQFVSRNGDPCDVREIRFSDGSRLVLHADFEQRANVRSYVEGMAPIYVQGEKSERREDDGLAADTR